MKTLLFTLLLLCITTSAFSQFVRRPGEADSSFIDRNTPNGLNVVDDVEMYRQMFPTTEWTTDKSLFAFYSRHYTLDGDDQEYQDLLGYLYLANGPYSYNRVFIDTFENEGGPAQITAIFYANADQDKERELVVMLKWPVSLQIMSGYIYETRIYDNIVTGPGIIPPQKMTYLKAISKKVSGGFEGDRDEKHSISKYKTAKEVREGLKR